MKCNFIKHLAILSYLFFFVSAWVYAEERSSTETQTSETYLPEKAADQSEVKKVVEINPSFNIFEFKVDGNTVLNKGKIEKAVYQFLGESKTIEDVEKGRAALEKAYQDAGYLTVTVSIPQQEVNKGIVVLKVTEGSVERLRVTGSKYTSLAEVKSRVAEFSEGTVPNFPSAQEELTTLNRGQNRQVTPVLRPGKSPGKVEVDLNVEDKLPLHGSLELNDKYSPNTTETRLNGSIRYENLWQKDHSISFGFQVSPENLNEVKVFSATYLIPRLNGDYFATYGVVSKSDISAVGDVNVIGDGYIAGVRYIHPLQLSKNYYHSITLGADYKDFKENVLLGADTSKTPISYTAFSLGYDGTYQTPTTQTELTTTLNLAPRALGNNEEEFANKRYLATPNYAYIRADLKYIQKLPYDWAILAKLSGQLTSEPLISAEEFTVGGVDSVRGYLESNALGDNGLSGTLELHTPPLIKYVNANAFNDSIKELYAYSFIDAGHVSIDDPLPNQIDSSNLLSVGLGIKLKAAKGLFTNLDFAHALRDDGTIKSGDNRLHFRLGYEW